MYLGDKKTLTDNWREFARHDYSQFLLPFVFDWFCTFTFVAPIHPEAADKAFRHFGNVLNRHIYGKRWRSRPPFGTRWIRATEWQKREVIHFHALFSGIQDHSPYFAQKFEKVWLEQMECGYARIDLLRGDQQAAKAYCTKYITKDGEIDFSINFANGSTLDWVNWAMRQMSADGQQVGLVG